MAGVIGETRVFVGAGEPFDPARLVHGTRRSAPDLVTVWKESR